MRHLHEIDERYAAEILETIHDLSPLEETFIFNPDFAMHLMRALENRNTCYRCRASVTYQGDLCFYIKLA